MTRNEAIRIIDKQSQRFYGKFDYKKFGINRRLLVFPKADIEWDIEPVAGGCLRVIRRIRSIGTDAAPPEIMEPSYVAAVMQAIATGSAIPEGDTI